MDSKSIYNLLKDYKKEDVDAVIAELSEHDKEIIRLRYTGFRDKSSMSPEECHYFYRSLIPKIKRMLVQMNKRPKSIYSYFPETPKNVVDEAILHLKPEYQHIVFLRFGEDLDNPICNKDEWTNKHMLTFHNRILTAIEKYIEFNVTGRIVKTIYELISEYSKEEIDAAIAKLPLEERELVYKRYGNDLSKKEVSKDWDTRDTFVFFRKVVPDIKSIVKKSRITIYSYFPEYTKEMVDDVVMELNRRDQALVVIFFDYDKNKFPGLVIDNVKIDINDKKNLKSRINYHLYQKYYRTKKTIFDYFVNSSKEDVYSAIDMLTNREKIILQLKYGDDFENPEKDEVWDKNYAAMFNDIIKKLSRILNGSRTHAATIYDYFPNISKEQLHWLLVQLPYEDKELIYLKYGEDLSNPKKHNTWSQKYTPKFQHLIIRLRKIVERTANFEEVLSFEDDSEYQSIINHYLVCKYNNKNVAINSATLDFGVSVQQTIKDALNDLEYTIVSLRYVENITIDNISNMLNISDSEVVQVLKRAILLYKKECINTSRCNNKENNFALSLVKTGK